MLAKSCEKEPGTTESEEFDFESVPLEIWLKAYDKMGGENTFIKWALKEKNYTLLIPALGVRRARGIMSTIRVEYYSDPDHAFEIN